MPRTAENSEKRARNFLFFPVELNISYTNKSSNFLKDLLSFFFSFHFPIQNCKLHIGQNDQIKCDHFHGTSYQNLPVGLILMISSNVSDQLKLSCSICFSNVFLSISLFIFPLSHLASIDSLCLPFSYPSPIFCELF